MHGRAAFVISCLHRRRRILLFALTVSSLLFLLQAAWLLGNPSPPRRIPDRRQYLPKPELTTQSANSHQGAGQRCVHPNLQPFDQGIMEHFKKEGPVTCSAMEDWVYITNGTFRISHRARVQHGEITCEYSPLFRESDFSVRFLTPARPLKDGLPLEADFSKVSCVSATGKKYSNLHSGAALNLTLRARLQQQAANLKKISHGSSLSGQTLLSKRGETRKAQFSNTPTLFQRLNLSVFILGFDSVSRMAWIRNLPLTRSYFLERLGGIELEGYNIVGDGTPSALLPILTGKMEEELSEARRGFSGAATVDKHPWVWQNFSRHGYVTAWAEDGPSIGTFHYRMLGFNEQPTDHYMRLFYLGVESLDRDDKSQCLGSTPHHVNFMRWFRDLFDVHQDLPKFFFGFHNELSHGDNNKIQAVDTDLLAFLKGLESSGYLNSTLLILMSDHGARFGHIRATMQGKLEERMPYFSFRFPPWFRQQYPDIIKNMEINAHRLTTPFDIHETFLDILNYTGSGVADIAQRGVSLLKEIPKERTCSDAEISPHWCACLEWKHVNQSDPFVMNAVQSAVTKINEFTQPQRAKCAELKLSRITRSAFYICSEKDSLSQTKIDRYWKQYGKERYGRYDGVFCARGTALYQVSFVTEPGEAKFEVLCSHDSQTNSFSVSEKEISRVNKYGSQPACLQTTLVHLRPYCYCV